MPPEATLKAPPPAADEPLPAARCVEIGMVVQHSPADDWKDISAAVVTDVGTGGVLAMTVMGRGRTPFHRGAVRHVSDPKSRRRDQSPDGVWRHGPVAAALLREVGVLKP